MINASLVVEDTLITVTKKIEERLQVFLKEDQTPAKGLIDSMRYSTLGGGKRFRPFLIYFIGTRLNINEEALIYLGACLELIHTYTLVHDDLPSMDNDDFRRGKPSNHKKFGEATAILAGDALQTEAFFRLSSSSFLIPLDIKLKIINLIADYCGAKNLISGQVFDVDLTLGRLENNAYNLEQINLLKTAKLISLACFLAGVLKGTLSKKDVDNLALYGEKLGLIFQLVDDIEDIKEDEISLVKLLDAKEVNSLLSKLKNETFDIVEIMSKSLGEKIKDLNLVTEYILKRL